MPTRKNSWIQLFRKYARFESTYDKVISPAATEEEIKIMRKAAALEHLVIHQDYIDFLKLKNGTSFNGLMLYGAAIPSDDIYRRVDFVKMNQYHDSREGATIIGTNDMDVYVIVGPKGPYKRLDRSSWDTIDEFNSCDELLFSIFSEQVESLKSS